MSWTGAVYTNIQYSDKTLAESDGTVAAAATKSSLYIAFKQAGETDIYVAEYTKGSWGVAQPTGVSSNFGPALALVGDDLYLLWNHYNDGSVHYGTVASDGTVTDLGAVPNVSSNNGPGAIGYGSALVCGHRGKDLSSKFYVEYCSDSTWSSSSKDYYTGTTGFFAPSFAATSSQVFVFIQNGMGVSYDVATPSSDTTSKNSPVPTMTATGQPGVVAFGSGYLVLVCGGSSGYVYSTCNLNDSNQWAYYGACGTNITGPAGPGLAYYSGIVYMVYAGSDNKLMMSTLPSAT